MAWTMFRFLCRVVVDVLCVHQHGLPAFASGPQQTVGLLRNRYRFLRVRTGELAGHGVINSVTDGGTDRHTSRCSGHLGSRDDLM